MKKLFYNGTIITMEEENSNAVLIENGIIKALGEEALTFLNEAIDKVDLKRKTMLPGFIDSHSHFAAFVSTLGLVNLKECTSFREMVETLKKFELENIEESNEPIIGFGYDQNFLEEKMHPTKQILDEISRPVLVSHVSGHMGVANSKMLELLGIQSETKDPIGGKIGRDQNGLTGYLEETAFHQCATVLPKNLEQLMGQVQKAQQLYFQYGITTAQEGLMRETEFQLLKLASDQGKLQLDLIGYVDLKNSAQIVKDHPEYVRKYQNHFKIGGYKLILDGSPQGRTAWMLKPYEDNPSYCGYPSYQDDELKELIRTSLKDRLQLLTHANGDAASEQLIRCFEEVQKKFHFQDLARPVMIHAQFVRENQLRRMKKLGMIASFFVAHTFYWGDIHLQNFGEKRAYKISPVKTAIQEGVCYTFHQDTPVILPNMWETIWCAVNRQTKTGITLGKSEQISVLEALRGVTTHAAYQYFEEMKKGSIKVGKQADLIIVDQNPFTISPEKLKEIQVVQTYKNGILVYEQ